MNEFTDEEISALHDALSSRLDLLRHEPYLATPAEHEATGNLYGRVTDEAHRRRLW